MDNGLSLGFSFHATHLKDNRIHKIADDSICFQIESRIGDLSQPPPLIPVQLMDPQMENRYHQHNHDSESKLNKTKSGVEEDEKEKKFRILGHEMTLKRKRDSDSGSSSSSSSSLSKESGVSYNEIEFLFHMYLWCN